MTSESPEGDSDRRSRKAVELAQALRDVAETIATADLDEEDLAAAVELAESLRARLRGPRRARWYEADAETTARGPEQRHEYLDHSPVRGPHNPLAPPLTLESRTREDGTRVVEGRARLGSAYEGPPHGVHGGFVAALFDEVLGATQGLEHAVGVTAILTVKYRHITPIGEWLRFTGWVAERRAGRLVVKATCHAGDRLTADAQAIFIPVDFNEVRDQMVGERGSSN